MTDGKPLNRVEETDGETLVVVKNISQLWGFRGTNTLTTEHQDLFVHTIAEDALRIGCAKPFGTDDGHGIDSANGIYYETDFIERPLTDEEITFCEDTFIYSGSKRPESVVEFRLPLIDDLRSAILRQDIGAYDELDAIITDDEKRHDVLTELQGNIEHEHLRQNKLNRWRGSGIGLLPEWDPENQHNDGKDRQHLYDMASMRMDAHLTDFGTVAGFPYSTFFSARHRVVGPYEPKLDNHEILPLEILDAEGWSYCRQCGAAYPEKDLLHVQLRHRDDGDTFRICDRCADNEHLRQFTEGDVSDARDKRAQQNGGQRRISGVYT